MTMQKRVYFFILLLIFTIACGFFTKTIVLNGSSMEPNIIDGQKLIVKSVEIENLKRGDIIYYVEPITGEEFVKRLIGMPGESVEIKNGIVYINNSVLEEPYIVNPATYEFPLLILENNEYFVLGDNRDYSMDSHLIGPIQEDAIMGVVIQ